MGCGTLEHFPGRLDAAADDGAARGVDAEGGADDGERDGETDAERGPHVRRRLGEEPAEVDALTAASQLEVKKTTSLRHVAIYDNFVKYKCEYVIS